MQRGGASRGRGALAVLAGAALMLLLTLALPEVPETKSTLPALPPLLEAESLYPSPLRTALELESRYLLARAPVLEPAVEGAPPAPIALTFDTEIPRGGEARQTVNEILDVLRQQNVRATFFVVGTWARANGDVLRRIADDGHEIANHSFDHRAFAHRSAAELRLDLTRVAALVASETGRPIAPFFRPPYGCADATAARLVREEGYAIVGWTATGTDANGSTANAIAVIESLARDLEPGAVILLHTNRWITAAALPDLLDQARQRHLEPTTLSAMLAQAPRADLERRGSRPCGSVLVRRYRAAGPGARG